MCINGEYIIHYLYRKKVLLVLYIVTNYIIPRCKQTNEGGGALVCDSHSCMIVQGMSMS